MPFASPSTWLHLPGLRSCGSSALFVTASGLWRIASFPRSFSAAAFCFVASLYASAALSGVLVETIIGGHTNLLKTEGYYLVRQLISDYMNVFAIKMAGVFTLSTSSILLRTEILPRWVAFSGFASASRVIAGDHKLALDRAAISLLDHDRQPFYLVGRV